MTDMDELQVRAVKALARMFIAANANVNWDDAYKLAREWNGGDDANTEQVVETRAMLSVMYADAVMRQLRSAERT